MAGKKDDMDGWHGWHGWMADGMSLVIPAGCDHLADYMSDHAGSL